VLPLHPTSDNALHQGATLDHHSLSTRRQERLWINKTECHLLLKIRERICYSHWGFQAPSYVNSSRSRGESKYRAYVLTKRGEDRRSGRSRNQLRRIVLDVHKLRCCDLPGAAPWNNEGRRW
jgi:hypothetical protein